MLGRIQTLMDVLELFSIATDTLQALQANTWTLASMLHFLRKRLVGDKFSTARECFMSRINMFASPPLCIVCYFSPNLKPGKAVDPAKGIQLHNSMKKILACMAAAKMVQNGNAQLAATITAIGKEFNRWQLSAPAKTDADITEEQFLEYFASPATKERFPLISTIVFCSVHCRCTEADVERLFSGMKMVVRPNRSAMSHECRLAQTILHFWAMANTDEIPSLTNFPPVKKNRLEVVVEENSGADRHLPPQAFQFINAITTEVFQELQERREKRRRSRGSQLCGVCKKEQCAHNEMEGTTWVECNECLQWYSAACLQLPQEAVQQLLQEPVWLCNACCV